MAALSPLMGAMSMPRTQQSLVDARRATDRAPHEFAVDKAAEVLRARAV